MNKRHYEHTLPNIRGSLSNTYLKKGDLVKVDGYGYFKPILTTKEGTDKTRLKDEDIVFAKIDFVLTVAGKEKLKDTQFVIKSKNL